jgi:hypothetical protein
MTTARCPVVAVVCAAPLLAEALSAAFDGVADVLPLPAGRADLAGLLESLAPAGVVVDDPADAAAAAGYSRRSGAPLLHVQLRDSTLAVWEEDGWRDSGSAVSAEHVRNVALAGIASARRSP